MREVVLGIDLGTSGAKAGLYTPEGRRLALGRSRGYTQDSPRPGWAEGNPEAWWSSVCDAVRQALTGVSAAEVAAVGLSVFFPAVVAMDREGKALRPAILYSDRRSVEEAAELERSLGSGVYRRRTGNPASTGTCAATSIRWILRHEPRVYATTRVLGFADTFLTWRLAGVPVADLTHAGLSGLVDIRRPERWDPEVCAAVGVDPALLPPIREAASVAGSVTARAARETGLPVGIPVVAGMGDAACASYGGGCVRPGSVGYVAGTTDCVTVPLDAPLRDHAWATLGYLRMGQWLGLGTMTSTGIAVEWFADRFYTGAPDQRVRQMAAEAEGAPPTDLLFLPYLQGERTPHWDPRASAVFSGLGLSITRADMARAVLEGTALGLRDVVDCLGERPREIRAFGGAMANEFWTRLKADALGMPLTVLQETETGSLGAALLAATALGRYGSPEQAAEAARRVIPVHVVEPGPERAARAEERLARYREIYRANRDLMHALAARPAP